MLIAILLIPIISIGQNVTISAPNSVEVGAPITIKANGSVPSGFTITGYKWSYTGISVGQHGPSVIKDLINGSDNATTYATPFTNTSSSTSNTITVVWGDVNNGDVFTDVNVALMYTDTAGVPKEVSAAYQVQIYRVKTPSITAPSGLVRIPKCCPNAITFVASSTGDQDTWNWNVTNGTPVGSTTSVAITVIPDLQNDVVLDVTVSRSSSTSNYTRNSNKIFARSNPPPITIVGADYVCIDNLITLSLGQFCGEIESVEWYFPEQLFYSDLDQDGAITLIPKPGIETGITVEIGVRVTLVGGCVTELTTTNVTIFNTENAPCPKEQFLTHTFPANFDPCFPSGHITINYNDPNFVNGRNTWTPHFVVLVPHHNIGDHIDVLVCNTNPCAETEEGKKCCKEYRIDLPAPCNGINSNDGNSGDLPINNDTPNSETSFANISIYPNPASNIINYQTNVSLTGWLSVYDKNGNQLYQQELVNVTNGSIDISELNLTGLVYIYFQDGNKIQSKTVIIE